ncbi:threonyl-tRNA synthetase [Scopulibacillus daqui]|uniref:Threonine--tRNA ligase n=1 Tax=Scopulibacillus daqui TaxID=1469162 RepID=A0ABS2PXA7_9BACL|nr:threonine--tRNA ligase [Scopulibacillus daqui]MBM7644591.1 threonyl-tRNA synthetase [Scopulibacillus daqui]
MNGKLIQIIFPDGRQKAFPQGATVEDIAGSISSSLKKKAVAGKVNGKLCDLRRAIHEDAALTIVTLDSDEGIDILRHTTAHVLAQAVKRIYGHVNFGVGPVIKNGFYYDMDLLENLSIDDLGKIEEQMQDIINENLDIQRVEVSREDAQKLFQNDPLKLELLKDIPESEKITIYKQGEFTDLCRGPHLPSTGYIKAFKLTNVSGAYWRGDSENKMLQRVYGAAFAKKQDLDRYLHFLDEAAERDHRKLGKALELFMFSEEAPGMPFYLPKGFIIRGELEAFLRELQRASGYEEVRTPFMMNQRLWEQSGHWDHYKENMYYSEVDHADFALKPMNCPGHMLIFKNKLRSYRDLPIRLAEFGQVHRHEFSGALNGMFRVRTFCQDDAHIYAAPSQIEDEIKEIMKLIDKVYSTFGFEYSIELSTRPEDSMGDDHLWEKAESALKRVLEDLNCDYTINEGDGAFYGPKIDFHIKDALNRSHQCATVQLDFQMPFKFDLHYVDDRGEKVRPVVIHRAVYGSLDRFFGILVEHFGGAFPVWLAPVQAKIVPVSQNHLDYAAHVEKVLKEAGIRVEIDDRDEKLGYKIRESQMNKIPYVLVAGDQEKSNNAVNVRKFGEKESETMLLKDFCSMIRHAVKERRLQHRL